MTIQIAVRLPDDVVQFLDAEVRADRAPSRAAVVLQALQAEQRRRAAVRDAEILTSASDCDEDDLDSLARFAAALPMGEG